MTRTFTALACIFLNFLLWSGTAQAQTELLLDWANSTLSDPSGSSDEGLAIAVDASGNTYITGRFSNTADFDPSPAVVNITSFGSSDAFVAKYDASGNYVYAFNVGGSSSDRGTGIAVDGSGNVYLTGYFQGTADFDPSAATENLTSAGQDDIFLAKYDADGNFQYARHIGGTLFDQSFAIAVDAAGNAHITGYFQGTVDFDPAPPPGTADLSSAGSGDIFLAKYDTDGNYVQALRIGGTSFDHAKGIAVDASGNTYITGYFQSTVDFDPSAGTANLTSAGSRDIFIAKYDVSGNYVFASRIGGTSVDDGLAIKLDASDNIHITGSFTGTVDFDPSGSTANLTAVGARDIYLAKYDASGNYVYAISMGGTTIDEGTGLAVDASGNVLITGWFQDIVDFDPSVSTAELTSAGAPDMFFAKYDASGNYVFAFNAGSTSSDNGYGVAVDASGNVHVVGAFNRTVDFDPSVSTANLVATEFADVFLAKYDASGNYLYANQIGVYYTSISFINDMVVDASGNSFVVGSFYGNVDFDPSPATATLTSAGESDIFFAKYDANGNYVFAIGIGSSGDDSGNGIALDGSGNILITGSFRGTVDFDPSLSLSELTSLGLDDIFLAKYDASGNYVYAIGMGGTAVDDSRDIVVDATGNAYITGFFRNTVDFDPSVSTAELTSAGVTDIFLAKYDASGDYVFAFNLGSTGGDEGASLALDASGNVHLTGFYRNTVDFDPSGSTANLISLGSEDIFVAKYNASGNYLNAFSVGGTSGGDRALGITVDGSGNTFVTGRFSGTADFDPSGATENRTSVGSTDIFLAKYDASGNYVYAIALGSALPEEGFGVAADAGGNAYVTGYYQSTIDFDPSAGTAELVSAGNRDIFLAKYDASGNYVYAKSMGGMGSDEARSVFVDANGRVYVSGGFTDTADFDPSVNTVNLTAGGSSFFSDGFVARYVETQGPWIGVVNTDWDNTGNWIDGTIPTSTDDVSIPSVAPNMPAINVINAECANLTVESGASLTVNPNKALTVSGNFTNNGTATLESDITGTGTIITLGTVGGSGTFVAQQYLTGSGGSTPDGRHWYVAPTVSSANSGAFSAAGDNRLWAHDEVAEAANPTNPSGWTEIADNATALSPMRGYAARLGATETLDYTGGAFNTGDLSLGGLTRTGTTNNQRGYSLVANPYPSFLNWDDAYAASTDLLPTIWYRTEQASTMIFATYNAEVGMGLLGATEFVHPGQAFWVRVNTDGNTGTFAVNNTMRSHRENETMRDGIDLIRLTLTNGTHTDEAMVFFNDLATNGADIYDSEKQMAPAEVPQLWSNVDDARMAINGINGPQTQPSVPLGIRVQNAGEYTITATELDLPVGAWLEDVNTGAFQSLDNEPSYAFSSEGGTFNGRFVLHFSAQVVGLDEMASGIDIFSYEKNINIVLSEEAQGTATVLDMAGRVITTTTLQGQRTTIPMDVSAGIYVVRVETGRGVESKRLLITD